MSQFNARIGRRYLGKLGQQITVSTLVFDSQDIAKWKRAIDSARSRLNPRRKLLYELYDNIAIDGHLESVMGKRSMAITNKEVQFVPHDEDGDVPEGIREWILEAPWFHNMLELATTAVPYGHALIELNPGSSGRIESVELINRANVRPEDGFVFYDVHTQSDGVYYREDAKYKPYLVEVGGRKDYGRLMTASQYVIYKRGAFGDWAQFAEIFGMPFRVGKYNPYDDATRIKLSDALEQAGGAAHIVIPDGTSLEFHDTNQAGKSEVFKDLVDACNSEISKIFLGQTMTTEDGSSKSQSQTHKEVEGEVFLSDQLRMQYLLNWQFKDRMIALGAGELSRGRLAFAGSDALPLDKQIEIYHKLWTMGLDIDPKFLYETFGVVPGENANLDDLGGDDPDPNDDGGQDPDSDPQGGGEGDNPEGGAPAPVPEDPKSDEDSKPDVPKKKERARAAAKLTAEVGLLYASSCCHPQRETTTIEAAGRDDIWQRIVRGVHSGKIKPGSVDPELHAWLVTRLMRAVFSGYGGNFKRFEPESADYAMLASLERNVHIFSAYKDYQALRAVTDELTDDQGKVRSFSAFKKQAAKVGRIHNVTYLQTEYNLAVASAQMASKWAQIQATKKDLPYLKFSTVGDANVRDDHQRLDGIVRKADDAFWDRFYPPLDYGCRCDVVQLPRGRATDLGRRNLPSLKPEFRTNTAKTGVVFPPKHPYYQVQKRDRAKARKLWGLKPPKR